MGRNHVGAHHTTRQKGLRNRNRTGRSNYSRQNKAASADRYSESWLIRGVGIKDVRKYADGVYALRTKDKGSANASAIKRERSRTRRPAAG